MPKLVRYSVIHAEAPLPDDLMHRHALYALYALQDWECLPLHRSEPYAPGYFYNHISGVLAGLSNISRETVLKHIASGECLVCTTPIDLTHSTLDHLMPLHAGGPETPSNVLMLCRRCNSSKGAKNLLDWWMSKAYKVTDLPRRILCLYARIYWQHLPESALGSPASRSTRTFLQERMCVLPSDAHRITLVGAAYAGCAYARWLKDAQP